MREASNNELSQLYSDKDYCNKEILEIRKVWNSLLTEKQIEAINFTLGSILVYCNGMEDVVKATFNELDTRQMYIRMLGGNDG